eukprot:Gb_26684 [translate_table: standard]
MNLYHCMQCCFEGMLVIFATAPKLPGSTHSVFGQERSRFIMDLRRIAVKFCPSLSKNTSNVQASTQENYTTLQTFPYPHRFLKDLGYIAANFRHSFDGL